MKKSFLKKCFKTGRRMIRFLSSFYDNYIKPYFSSGLEEPDRSHKNKILKAGRLIRNTQLPRAVRADAARDIGILSYTGDEKNGLYDRRTPFYREMKWYFEVWNWNRQQVVLMRESVNHWQTMRSKQSKWLAAYRVPSSNVSYQRLCYVTLLHLWTWITKPVISITGIFVAIDKNTLYWSKL